MRGSVNESLALGTLAAQTLVSADFDETVLEKTLVSSIVSTWTISNWTGVSSNGPLLVGVAHSDYTDAEIEAVLESTGSWSEGDKVAQEVSKRLVRRIGVFRHPRQSSIQQVVLNDGKPIKTKLNWTLATGARLNLWAYNTGTAAFATTDPTVRAEGHANLWKL